ncbi:MAG TPA: hypothetical protein V6C72_17590 [Chroococcales cyanobacterium]
MPSHDANFNEKYQQWVHEHEQDSQGPSQHFQLASTSEQNAYTAGTYREHLTGYPDLGYPDYQGGNVGFGGSPSNEVHPIYVTYEGGFPTYEPSNQLPGAGEYAGAHNRYGQPEFPVLPGEEEEFPDLEINGTDNCGLHPHEHVELPDSQLGLPNMQVNDQGLPSPATAIASAIKNDDPNLLAQAVSVLPADQMSLQRIADQINQLMPDQKRASVQSGEDGSPMLVFEERSQPFDCRIEMSPGQPDNIVIIEAINGFVPKPPKEMNMQDGMKEMSGLVNADNGHGVSGAMS